MFKRISKRAKNIYFDLVLRNRMVAKLFPFKQPSILLMSYPRSGSSWIGSILSLSPDITYLREPINQSFQYKFGRETVVDTIIDPDIDSTTLHWYSRFSDQAFAGIPPKNIPNVIDTIDDFAIHYRSRKSLLLKEVNPLATNLFVRRYSPKVVLILRHPAAIADSFARMGWLGDNFEEFGYIYGVHLNKAVESSKRLNPLLIFFEELATDPFFHFPTLFSSLNVSPPANLSEILEEFCEKQNTSQDPYEVRRVSRNEVYKWRQSLRQADIEAVKRGFFRSPLEYYRAEMEWS
jgi:hypothetical protein